MGSKTKSRQRQVAYFVPKPTHSETCPWGPEEVCTCRADMIPIDGRPKEHSPKYATCMNVDCVFDIPNTCYKVISVPHVPPRHMSKIVIPGNAYERAHSAAKKLHQNQKDLGAHLLSESSNPYANPQAKKRLVIKLYLNGEPNRSSAYHPREID